MKIDVLGVKFDDISSKDAASAVMGLINDGKKGYVVTPNPEIVMECRKDEKLKDVVNEASFVLPDGIGVLYGAKILGRPMKNRAPGIDFAQHMFSLLAKEGKSVFLLGAKQGVAEKAAENIEKDNPGIVIAGTNDGYFKDAEPVIEKINEAKPDFLVVCLGFPKQEFFMAENMDRLDVKYMAGLGGSMDVFAGIVARAPEKWRKLGLEWLYRLTREPSRIKRMARLPLFIFVVIGRRIKEIFS